MYLMRIGAVGAEKPVARVDDETHVDLSDTVTVPVPVTDFDFDFDFDFDEAFFGSGGLDRVRPVVAERTAAGQVAGFAGERIGAPIARPRQILCSGLNYRGHAAESGMAVPDEPSLFTHLIDTGTPPGVGMGFKPPVWLRPRDVTELGITPLPLDSRRRRVLGPR